MVEAETHTHAHTRTHEVRGARRRHHLRALHSFAEQQNAKQQHSTAATTKWKLGKMHRDGAHPSQVN